MHHDQDPLAAEWDLFPPRGWRQPRLSQPQLLHFTPHQLQCCQGPCVAAESTVVGGEVERREGGEERKEGGEVLSLSLMCTPHSG